MKTETFIHKMVSGSIWLRGLELIVSVPIALPGYFRRDASAGSCMLP